MDGSIFETLKATRKVECGLMEKSMHSTPSKREQQRTLIELGQNA